MIYQAQRKGCGFACVKMLLSLNGVKEAEEIEEPLLSSQAPSLGELISFASEHGLTLSGYKFLEPSGLLSHKEFPILLLLEEKGQTHMVVLAKARGSYFLVLDPMKGRRWVKKSELAEKTSLFYLKQLSFAKKPEKKGAPPYQRKRRWGDFLAIFPVLEGLLGLCALSTLRQDGSFLVLAIFLLAYCLCLASRTLFSFKAMKRFDEEYLSGCLFGGREERKERFCHYNAYKKASLLSPLNLAEDAVSFFLIYALLFFNDPLFGLLCIAPISLCALEKILSKGKDEKDQEAIENAETRFLEGKKGDKGALLSLKEGLRESYAFAERKACVGLFDFSLCAFSSSLALLLGPATSNRFLFCLFSSCYLLHLVSKLWEDFSLWGDKKKEWPYFRLHFLSGFSSPKKNGNGKINP